ncbi:MAG TPA: hypothetical protein PK857_00550 [Hyphomicrobium sp.]|nr:hypothetical protein [Hyphomicrobium sp.]HRO48770.1 hypothetical protein [Hyphomicrobium sp.]
MRTTFFDLLSTFFRAPDDGGAGGSDAGADANAQPASLVDRAAAAAAADGAAAAAAGGGGDAPYFPENLPDALKGQTNQETIDKLFQDIAGRPAPPETPDGYSFAFSEDFTKRFGELNGDDDGKVMGVVRATAHALGMSDQQATGFVEKIYSGLDEAGLLDVAPDPDGELEKLMPQAGDPVSRQTAAFKRINEANAWVKSLEAKGLEKAGGVMLSALLESAEGVKTIEFLQKTFAQPGLQNGGQPGGVQPLTDHERSMRALYPSMFKS